MREAQKKFLILVSLVVCWLGFVMFDCYRIKNSQPQAIKPLITMDHKESESKRIYDGLGYRVTYYQNDDHSIYGADCKVFSLFHMWGWVE